MRRKLLSLFLFSVFVVVLSGLVTFVDAKEASRITKEELKGIMGSKDLILIDVRSGMDWNASEMKIQGAVREDPGNVESWSTKYPKDKSLVLYCA